MDQLPQPVKLRPYTRSPILIAAYGAFIAAVMNMILGSGVIWTAGSAGIAVLFALVEIVLQVRRRGASA